MQLQHTTTHVLKGLTLKTDPLKYWQGMKMLELSYMPGGNEIVNSSDPTLALS